MARATGNVQPRCFSAAAAYRLVVAMSCQMRSLIQPATVLSKMSVLNNVGMVCLLSYTWGGWTSQDDDAAYVIASNESSGSHDSKRHKPPPFLLELRDRHPTKLKPHQSPRRVTTRIQ